MKRRLTLNQWAIIILALPGGFLLGLMTGFLQACTLHIGFALPWGLVASLFLIWLSVRLPSYALGTRWVGVLVTFGWLIGTVLLAIKTPAGDQVLIGDTGSMIYIALASVCVGVAAAWPLVPPRDVPPAIADSPNSSDPEGAAVIADSQTSASDLPRSDVVN